MKEYPDLDYKFWLPMMGGSVLMVLGLVTLLWPILLIGGALVGYVFVTTWSQVKKDTERLACPECGSLDILLKPDGEIDCCLNCGYNCERGQP